MKKIKAGIEVLTQGEIQAIHEGTLKVLERVGFKVPNDFCLDACEKLGAKVDRDACTVRVQPKLMEEVLAELKKASTVDASKDYYPERLKGNISTQIFMVDYKSRTRRYGTMEDVVKGIMVSDKLQNIRASNAIVVPHDVPHNMSDVLSYQAIYTYSANPGNTYILSPISAKYIIQMNRAMGKKISYFLETVSPLQFTKESLEMAVVFAKQGEPISLGPMVVAGATGPITIAGTATLQNSEILASAFLIYAMKCNCLWYGSYNHSMDLRTTICSFGSPNQALLGMAAAQMGRHYGFTVACNSGLTDSVFPDFQGGFEKASSAIFSCLAGAYDVGAQGIVGADQGLSLEQLVIDNEWLDAYNYILQGIEVDADTIAAEVIESVGIGGNYISEDHTVEYMRDNYWASNIFNRENWDAIISRDSSSVLDKAHDYVQSILGSYPPVPVLEKSKLDEINYIADCAKDELSKQDK